MRRIKFTEYEEFLLKLYTKEYISSLIAYIEENKEIKPHTEYLKDRVVEANNLLKKFKGIL